MSIYVHPVILPSVFPAFPVHIHIHISVTIFIVPILLPLSFSLGTSYLLASLHQPGCGCGQARPLSARLVRAASLCMGVELGSSVTY